MSSSNRLQCILAARGVDSRRHCASLIAGGAVAVDGVVVREPGFHVENPDTARIEINGRILRASNQESRHLILLMNKPRGLVCSADDSHAPTVFSLLRGLGRRVVTAGRLDRDSDGLLVLSDDGDLINRLTHPRHGHEKRYRVQCCGIFGQDSLDALQSPMEIDGYRIRPVRVQYLKRLADGDFGPRHRLLFTLREGRNRQIRKMCEAVGLKVESLTRVAINGLELPSDLKSGMWREITPREAALLEKIPSQPLKPWQPA